MARLSLEDVAQLRADPSPAARVALVRKVSEAVRPGSLSPSERVLAEEIFAILARDAERLVRVELARCLHDSPALSRPIARKLAADIDEVAIPVLTTALVLTDEDLIEIVRGAAVAKQMAIASRARVSESVAGVLVESESSEVVAALVRNGGANLDSRVLCRALDRFGQHEPVQSGIAVRDVLPIQVADRLIAVATAVICAQLMARADLPADLVPSLILRSREQAILGLRETASSDESAVELVRYLAASGRLTPSFCLRTLCVGDAPLFETAMAKLSGLSLLDARYLMHEAGEPGFSVLYDKCGLSPQLQPAFRLALQVCRQLDCEGGTDNRHEREALTIERILTQYEQLGSPDMDFLLRRLGAFGHMQAA